jgi:hypothetical protein
MILRSNNRILDFNDDIEMERICKLFEKIDSTNGDFSYKFEIPFTKQNDEILTFPFADVSSKRVYKNIDCELMDNDGDVLYNGFLRVERVDFDKRLYECSFFSGNLNWISKLTGQVSDADFSAYAVQINETNIVNSWTQKSGVVFRLFDSGNLITRSHDKTVIEDWAPMMFVKEIFFKIFNSHSIKIQGDILNDWAFNNMLVCANTHDQDEVDNRTSFVAKNTTQTVTSDNTIITFQDDSTYPYYNSPNNNWNLVGNSYIADSKTILRIEAELTYNTAAAHIAILKNGVVVIPNVGSSSTGTASFIRYISVVAGDVVQLEVLDTFGITQLFTFTLKISPAFLYDVLGKNVVPKWTQQQFVTNVLSLFNVVSDYDNYSKTITFNLFEKLSSRESRQLPVTIQSETTDYVEFISNYGKNNYFGYNSGSDENLKQYNVTHFIRYGQGNIPVDNDFLQLSAEVVKSDFTSPISYINKQLGSLSLERTNIFESQSTDTQNVNVTNNAGTARFNVPLDTYLAGFVVKIEMDSISQYNGEWVISTVGSGYFEVSDIKYVADDDGKATLLITKTTSSDNVYIFLDAGARNYIDIGAFSSVYIGANTHTQPGYCYFSLLYIGKPVNALFNQSLSFGIDNKTSAAASLNQNYQRSLLDTYWPSFKRILNDPAKMYMKGFLSKKTFKDIGPLNPVTLQTEESANQYYVNRITSYKNSYSECTLELIKL